MDANRQNVPQLDSLALDLLRTLAQKDLILDDDAPDDAIALATLFGTSVKGLGKAQLRLVEQGFAEVVQETNRRVRASISGCAMPRVAIPEGVAALTACRLWGLARANLGKPPNGETARNNATAKSGRLQIRRSGKDVLAPSNPFFCFFRETGAAVEAASGSFRDSASAIGTCPIPAAFEQRDHKQTENSEKERENEAVQVAIFFISKGKPAPDGENPTDDYQRGKGFG